MKKRHEPIRECICCGNKFQKTGLFRIVQNESGIFLDREGKAEGRGAYICKSQACREKLVQQRRLNRAFKKKVEDSVYGAITAALETAE